MCSLVDTGIILCMSPANERWRYIIMSSLIVSLARLIHKMIPVDTDGVIQDKYRKQDLGLQS